MGEDSLLVAERNDITAGRGHGSEIAVERSVCHEVGGLGAVTVGSGMAETITILAGILAGLVLLHLCWRVYVDSRRGRMTVFDTLDMFLFIVSVAVLLTIAASYTTSRSALSRQDMDGYPTMRVGEGSSIVTARETDTI